MKRFVPCLISLASFAGSSLPSFATLVEPTGFQITVSQGGSTIAQQIVTIGPSGDLVDIKISDGTPESFTQIGTLGGGGPNPSPIILKVVTEDDPIFRILHLYIDAPVSLANINAAGPHSLFDTSNPNPISVSIANATFSGGTAVSPQVQNSNSFFTAFMRDQLGHFYEMPQANAYNSYLHGINDIQVPGERFLDANNSLYAFSGTDGSSAAWSWSALPNPGPLGTTVNTNPTGGQPSSGNGYVFELGLAMAYTIVPEPPIISMLVMGLVILGMRPVRRTSDRT